MNSGKVTVAVAIRVIIPMAMVTAITLEMTRIISTNAQLTSWLGDPLPTPLVVIIAITAMASGVGIELWGIQSGDNFEKSWRLSILRTASSIQMIAYFGIGTALLWDAGILVYLPAVATAAYITASISYTLNKRSTLAETVEATTMVNDAEISALERKFAVEERKAEAEQRRANAQAEADALRAERLARIEAGRQLDLAKVNAAAQVQAAKASAQARLPASAQAKSAQASRGNFTCPYCNTPGFKSQRAVYGHYPFCSTYQKAKEA